MDPKYFQGHPFLSSSVPFLSFRQLFYHLGSGLQHLPTLPVCNIDHSPHPPINFKHNSQHHLFRYRPDYSSSQHKTLHGSSCAQSQVQRLHMAWKVSSQKLWAPYLPQPFSFFPWHALLSGSKPLVKSRFAVSSSTISHVSLQGTHVVARPHPPSVQDLGQGSALHSGVLYDQLRSLPNNHAQDHKDSLQVHKVTQRQRGLYHLLPPSPLTCLGTLALLLSRATSLVHSQPSPWTERLAGSQSRVE